MMTLVPLLFLATSQILAQTPGGQYLGAAGVLAKVAKPADGSALANPRLVFIGHAHDFERREPGLTPDEAARQWLDLAREGLSLPRKQMEFRVGYRTEYLKVLPPPAAWPKIEALLDNGWGLGTNRPALLGLLMEALEGRNREALKIAYSMDKADRGSPWSYYLPLAEMELAIRLKDADAIDQLLVSRPMGQQLRGGPVFDVPDMVPAVGRERASRILLKLLSTKKGEFTFGDPLSYIDSPCETQKLALEIAKAHPDQLAYPQWNLAYSPDAGDLFEHMTARFPAITVGLSDSMGWSSYQGAAIACLVDLWMDGQVARARSFAVKYAPVLGFGFSVSSGKETLIRRLADTGKLDGFVRFLGQLTVDHLGARFPEILQPFAESAPAPLIEAVVGKCLDKSPSDHALGLGAMYLNALLAQGKYSQAAAELLRNGGLPTNDFFRRNDAAILRRLSDLLHRPDLALLANERAAKYTDPSVDEIDAPNLDGPQMERRLVGEIRKAMANPSGNDSRMSRYNAAKLARLYHRAGRDGDVVTLLDEFPGWGVPDLRYADNGGELASTIAPLALEKAGRHEDAVRLVEFALATRPNDGREYDLMLQVAPDEAGSFLERLARQFPLNQGPLLWRAEWLRRKHRLSEAKALCERGIALDPLEIHDFGPYSAFKGEEVLAAIDRDMGDVATADSLGKYARAAKLLEDADELSRLRFDLLAESAYRQVLELLPSYCPARYALGETEIRNGNIAEGPRDIDLAVKALPPKIDARTYLPFGGSSTPLQAQLALRTSLHALIAGGSTNATVYFYASQVDSQMGDGTTAIREAQRAAELDPDCLGAWIFLADADGITDDLQKQARINAIRLGQPYSWEHDRILDYAAAWQELAAVPPPLFGPEDPVLLLPASRLALTQHADEGAVDDLIQVMEDQNEWHRHADLANDSLIAAIGKLLATEGD